MACFENSTPFSHLGRLSLSVRDKVLVIDIVKDIGEVLIDLPELIDQEEGWKEILV